MQRNISIKATWVKIISMSLLPSMIFTTGCKKLIEVHAPPTATTSDNVYQSDATAAAVLTGMYTQMSAGNFYFVTGSNSLSVEAGLAADELTLAGGNSNQNTSLVKFYTNNLTPEDAEPWTSFYTFLLPINSAITKMDASTTLTPVIKQQLLGEAKFLRALAYFYLINLYGDVPLILTSDYRVNSTIARSSKPQVVQQIITDLQDAKSMLSDGYVGSDAKLSTSERLRPNKWVVAALLARVYLYEGDWANAEKEATSVIDNSALYSLPALDDVFLINSKEAIWQLQPINSDMITEDARLFVLDAEPGDFKPVYLSSLLLNEFDSNDMRRTKWIMDAEFNGVSYSYPFKYRAGTSQSSFTEYLMVFRLAEQYLIRAEARAQQNNLTGAIDDLDKIRNRAGLPLIAVTNPGIDKTTLINTILHERQVELFTEWGHRWLDLKRTGNINSVMGTVTPQKGGNWNSNWALFPIPYYDIKQNPNLTQNGGY